MKPIFKFWGKAVAGKKRGKRLGFPTANIPLHHRIAEGVYFSKTRAAGSWYNSLTFLGPARTFGEEDYKKAETFLLGFQGNLRGKWLTVKLLKRLRGNRKFGSAEELKLAMQEDLVKARKFFKTASTHHI